MMEIIKEQTFEKIRKKVKETIFSKKIGQNQNHKESKEIVFSSDNDDLNRKILEKLPINILLINLAQRRDRLKQRDSGLNHVLAKIAKKNKITIGINLDELIEAKDKEKIIARIKQNIKLCNKNKVKMKFIQQKNKRNIYDLKSLGLILGMPTWMTKGL